MIIVFLIYVKFSKHKCFRKGGNKKQMQVAKNSTHVEMFIVFFTLEIAFYLHISMFYDRNLTKSLLLFCLFVYKSTIIWNFWGIFLVCVFVKRAVKYCSYSFFLLIIFSPLKRRLVRPWPPYFLDYYNGTSHDQVKLYNSFYKS